MPLQPGKTITKNGKTYILNEHHRWTLKEKTGANPRQAAQQTPQQTQQRAQPQSPGGRTVDRKTFDDSYAKQSQPKFDPSTGLKMPGAGTGTSPGYDGKVRNLEKQGMTTSDAQGIADMEELRNDPNSPIGKPKSPPQQTQQPKTPKLIKSGAEDDPNHDGIADQARVGVGAFEVPPPPKKIRRLPGLTGKAKKAESQFAEEFENNSDAMAEKAHIMFTASAKPGEPPTFETDAAKKLSPYWASTELDSDLERRSKNRATLNTALHQTSFSAPHGYNGTRTGNSCNGRRLRRWQGICSQECSSSP
jgi:hypothetical protein